ncbi:MAG: energy transducer TonB [Armatimonadota bacterium]
MTAAVQQLSARQPLSARARYGVATASSIAFHAIVLAAIGLLAARAPERPEVLIPIELTVSEQSADRLDLGGGRPEAVEVRKAASATPRAAARPPSSPGGRAKAAPAAPRILTSKKGKEPAGATGAGRDLAGPGGQTDEPAGPTRGPGVSGGLPPVYPKDALDQGLEGTVTVTISVAADGSVKSLSVTRSSGHKLLDDAALRAVKTGWTVTPALQKGKPAAGTVSVTFVFSAGKVKEG